MLNKNSEGKKSHITKNFSEMVAICKYGEFVSVLFPESTAGKPLGYLLSILQNSQPTLQIIPGGMLDALCGEDGDDDTWFPIAFLTASADGVWTNLTCTSENLCQLAFHANHQRPFAMVLTKKIFLATNSYVTVGKPNQPTLCQDGMLFFVDSAQSDSKGNCILHIDGSLVNATLANAQPDVNGKLLVCVRRSDAVVTITSAEPAKDRDLFERVDDWVTAALTQIGVF